MVVVDAAGPRSRDTPTATLIGTRTQTRKGFITRRYGADGPPLRSTVVFLNRELAFQTTLLLTARVLHRRHKPAGLEVRQPHPPDPI